MKVSFYLLALAIVVHEALANKPTKPKPNTKKITQKSSPNGHATKILGGSMADSKYVKGSAQIYYQYYDDYYGYEYYSICSGSIVGNKWILTAAHCVTDEYGYYDYYTYGAIPATKFATLKEIYDYGGLAKKVYIHKDYMGGHYEYDIALLELEVTIPSSRYTKVSLVAPPSGDEVTVKAVGYGYTDVNGGPYETDPLRLMMTDMKYREYDWCKAEDNLMYSPVEGQMLCATSMSWPTGDTGVCYGDSGGPLFKIRNDDKLQQFGLLSYGNSYICGDYASFDWFVQVSHVKKAISKKNSNYFDIHDQYYMYSGSDKDGTPTPTPANSGPNRDRSAAHWSRDKM